MEENYRMGDYTPADYSPLLRPDGTVVATLTEPEDRTWYRDLAPVIDELNALHTENEALREALRVAREALGNIMQKANIRTVINAHGLREDTDTALAAIDAALGGGDRG